jgi:uncharacterized protein
MFRRHLKVEVAKTPSQHQRGLMFRDKLGEDDGMIFEFSKPQNLRFWGLNTYIPLAVAFVSPSNIIEKIDYISPFSTKVVESVKDCNVAIEANYDFFRRNKVGVGDSISIIEDKDRTLIKFD